jgi:hypothetical protein
VEGLYEHKNHEDQRKTTIGIGKTFTKYLQADTAKVGGTVMEHIWCRPGETACSCASIGMQSTQVQGMAVN